MQPGHDVLSAFPAHHRREAVALQQFIESSSLQRSRDLFTVDWLGETLAIPERIYFESLLPPRGFSGTEQLMLDCLLARHHDGHVREASLRRVLDCRQAWCAPFVVRIAGEYVIEILQVIEAHLSELDAEAYGRFVRDNRPFQKKTNDRIVSYWRLYHRASWPNFACYPGGRIASWLEQCAGLA